MKRGDVGRVNGCGRERTCQLEIRTLRATAALAGLALPCRRNRSVWTRCGAVSAPGDRAPMISSSRGPESARSAQAVRRQLAAAGEVLDR